MIGRTPAGSPHAAAGIGSDVIGDARVARVRALPRRATYFYRQYGSVARRAPGLPDELSISVGGVGGVLPQLLLVTGQGRSRRRPCSVLVLGPLCELLPKPADALHA